MGKDFSWGATKRKQINNERKKGREISVVKEELRAFSWKDISNIKEFRQMVRISSNEFATIGYCRKSKTKESKSAVENSLNLQIQKLKTKRLCEHVFVSWNTNADEKIEDRDLNKQKKYDIKNNAGDCQDMIECISMSLKKIRLVVIDYAGLSTNPDDIRGFFCKFKQLKELIVDEGHKVSCLTRYEILNNDDAIKKFNCRTACIKRSK